MAMTIDIASANIGCMGNHNGYDNGNRNIWDALVGDLDHDCWTLR